MSTATRPIVLSAALACLLGSGTASAQFTWTDTEGKHLELTHQKRPLARYVYEPIDESSPERREETYKPFCHLYSNHWKHEGKLLTKGPGGKFPHHRGVFYGFSKISYTDGDGVLHRNVDTWHCRKAHQIHRRFTDQGVDAKGAWFTSEIDWIGDNGKAFATEARTMRFSLDDRDLVVDFESSLAAKVTALRLDGDPQHAGFHFRAHNDVHDKTQNATYYIRPGTGVGKPGVAINWSDKNDTELTRDLPWKAMCFSLDDTLNTVVYLDHPENPKPARASERQYGRFGTYFATDLSPKKPLLVRYRLVVHPGELKLEEVETIAAAFPAF